MVFGSGQRPRSLGVERRVWPVFVGFRLASGALGAVSAQCDLRSDDDQGQPDDLIDREVLAEQDHTVEEREDGRQNNS